jgi:hypothetical protein
MDWLTTCIIGGGPSATRLDTTQLAGVMRLGVNDAAFHVECDAFFSNDHNYALGVRASIEAFPGERHLSVWHRHQELFAGWRGVRIWRRTHGLAPAQHANALSSGGHATPGCSGYVALNLALQMGARRIVLFGYDFHDTYSYFFSSPLYPRRDIPGVRRSFLQVAPHYAALGVEIVNANPASAITAFPVMDQEEAIWLARQPLSTIPAPETMTTAGARRSAPACRRTAGKSAMRVTARRIPLRRTC